MVESPPPSVASLKKATRFWMTPSCTLRKAALQSNRSRAHRTQGPQHTTVAFLGDACKRANSPNPAPAAMDFVYTPYSADVSPKSKSHSFAGSLSFL